MKFSVAVASSSVDRNSPFLFYGDIVASAKKAQEIGYDAVELYLSSPAELSVTELWNYCDKSGMRVSSFGTGPCSITNNCNLMSDDEEVRRKAINFICDFIKMAAPFHAGVIVGNIRGDIPQGGDVAFYRKRLKDGLLRIVQYTEQQGVDIYLETINRYEKNDLNRVSEMLDFITECGSDRLKLHLDTFHMNIEEPSMSEAIALGGSKIGHVHLADNTRHYPGQGTLDFKALLTAFEDADFQGFYTLESLAVPDGDTAAKGAIGYLKSLSSQ